MSNASLYLVKGILKMAELTKLANNVTVKEEPISNELAQLNHINIDSVFLTDPEGKRIEIKSNKERNIVFSKDETGKSVAIETRKNGTKVYHISKDHVGLPSSHEVRIDKTEIVYFYNVEGQLQHFVELKPNGDRISTILNKDGSLYSIEQKQIGGIVFQAWLRNEKTKGEGMIWLHPDGEITTYGNESVISDLKLRFAKFLDGITV